MRGTTCPGLGECSSREAATQADVAIATTFGPNTLESFQVWTDEIAESVPALR